jgi:hypothetical protein
MGYGSPPPAASRSMTGGGRWSVLERGTAATQIWAILSLASDSQRMWMGEWGPTQKILISKWPKCPGGIFSTKLFQLIHPFNLEINYFFSRFVKN